ncbi:MAG: c-type cytochrome, partial [Aliifodinibius sp.]|nr:c-type cytochrome [Fodinibius sp.]
TLPKRIPEIDIGLRQRWNQDLDKIDRCTTCHISIDNPEFSEAAQPYTSHPEIYHDVQEIGCTTCHQGQGLATNTAEAHGKTKYWEKPMLPVEYLEASCGKCHQNGDVPKAPILSRGRRLLADFSCAGCHRLGGIKPATFKPSLDGIGKKTNRAWLLRWLKNPEEVRPDTKMPDFHLPEQEANILTDFLMSQLDFADNIKLSPIPEKLSARLKDPDFISRGKGIFRKARCVSCHTVEQRGGSLAPELGNIGSKTNAVWLYNFLENPKRLQPNIPMPQYGFSDEQRAAVVAYMVNDFQDWGWSPDTSGHTQDPDYYDKGKKIFKSYNCGGCHQLSGIEGSSETGPDLRQIADKPLYQFDFGRLDSLPKTKANFIYL